jgi:hypothetical protein
VNTQSLLIISSFIIRFVLDTSAEPGHLPPSYRGEIRHIQTGEEIRFITWSEAQAFMQRFVPLELN